MKILAVSHEYPPVGGGGANACLFLLDIFAKRGHSVSLVTTAFEDLPGRETTAAGVRIYRVSSKRKKRENCSLTEMFSFLTKGQSLALKLAKSEGFDTVVVFFGIPAGPIGVTLRRKLNLPFIIRFGGSDVPGFRESYSFIYKLLSPSIKNIWRNAGARIANSIGLRDLAYAFCDKYPFDIIPNGVDTAVYMPRGGDVEEIRVAGKGIYNILFVSRILERKGLQHIIPQLPGLRDELSAKGIDVRLTIVGDGPYIATLEELVQKYKVADICSFEGQKNKSEIVDYYQDADVFILPSAKEGMPNVVLEAMASGLPVIMTPCQGSEELMSGNGFVCPPEEFGKKLFELAVDDALRTSQGKRSLELVRAKFSWDIMADKYLEIMRDVCDKHSIK